MDSARKDSTVPLEVQLNNPAIVENTVPMKVSQSLQVHVRLGIIVQEAQPLASHPDQGAIFVQLEDTVQLDQAQNNTVQIRAIST